MKRFAVAAVMHLAVLSAEVAETRTLSQAAGEPMSWASACSKTKHYFTVSLWAKWLSGAHIYAIHAGRESPLPYAQDVASNNTAAAVHDLEADHASGQHSDLICT